MLPAIIGGHASLNLFTAPVGPSGLGKDIANEAARGAVNFVRVTPEGIELPVDEPFSLHPGPGEGTGRGCSPVAKASPHRPARTWR